MPRLTTPGSELLIGRRAWRRRRARAGRSTTGIDDAGHAATFELGAHGVRTVSVTVPKLLAPSAWCCCVVCTSRALRNGGTR